MPPDNGYWEKFVESRFETMTTRLDGMDKALSLKTSEVDRRLESMNELRSEVTKDRDILVRRETFDVQISALNSHFRSTDANVDSVDRRLLKMETKVAAWAGAVIVIFSLVQVAIKFWR